MKYDGFAFLHVLWLRCSLSLVIQWNEFETTEWKVQQSQLRQMWKFTSVLNISDNIVTCLCWTASRFVAWTHYVTVKTSLIPSIDRLHFWVLVVHMVDVAFVRISGLSLVSFGQYSCNFVKTRVYALNCTDMHVLDSSCRY